MRCDPSNAVLYFANAIQSPRRSTSATVLTRIGAAPATRIPELISLYVPDREKLTIEEGPRLVRGVGNGFIYRDSSKPATKRMRHDNNRDEERSELFIAVLMSLDLS